MALLKPAPKNANAKVAGMIPSAVAAIKGASVTPAGAASARMIPGGTGSQSPDPRCRDMLWFVGIHAGSVNIASIAIDQNSRNTGRMIMFNQGLKWAFALSALTIAMSGRV